MMTMMILFSVVCGVCVECGFGILAAWLGTGGDGGVGLNVVLEDVWMGGDGGMGLNVVLERVWMEGDGGREAEGG